MKKVKIYTDGACSVNPGPGGWGCILIYNGNEREYSGFENNTTNNRMEMLSVIKALEKLKEKCEVDLYSDSAYVVNAFLQNWIPSWKEKGWKTAGNKVVKNLDLWQKLCELTDYHIVHWNKVKGHSSDEYNNRCDALARGEVDKYLKENKDKAYN